MTITSADVVSYRPAIGEYTNYDAVDNPNVFDSYITSSMGEINRYLANDGVNVSEIPDDDLNLKYLYLSHIVYLFYFLDKLSTDIDNKQLIEELKSEYQKNYNIVLKQFKTVDNNTSINNGVTINYLG